ncbi:hypothetical protein C9374_009273 [Naegleria lovaniensis]|uniref:Transmembrane protein n=1 Tax=Naegleria lovaniensis TaxID=51637 RepID=A0AA88GDD3_NAELO|nr:uncharacterized protein C9374_009273 [Naegleria lovaniensis]KAG2377362.1 hypothetical protein C9374_009273 [Naegleria lovaniensis]
MTLIQQNTDYDPNHPNINNSTTYENQIDSNMVQYQMTTDPKEQQQQPPTEYQMPMQLPPPQQVYLVMPNNTPYEVPQSTLQPQTVQYVYTTTASANAGSMANVEPIPQGLMNTSVQVVSSPTTENAGLLNQDTDGNYVMKAGCNEFAWITGVVGCIFLILFPFLGLPFLLLAIFQRNSDYVFDDKSKEMVIHLYGAFIPFGCLDREERIPYHSISDIVIQEDWSIRVNGQPSAKIFALLKNGSSVQMTKGYTARAVASSRARKIKELLRERLTV